MAPLIATNGVKRTYGQTSNEPHVINGYHHPEPELCKIIPNALYLTFNAPRVDDYHRAIFLTDPLTICLPTPQVSGNLYHASYIDDPSPPHWVLEGRVVNDLSSSKSLVLLYRIATFVDEDMENILQRLESVLEAVPLGRDARTRALGPRKGNPKLGGYDCVIWTIDSLNALRKAGLLGPETRSGDEIMSEARSLAGPPDAKSMVGVQHDFKVIN